jgi:hypothetical protein
MPFRRLTSSVAKTLTVASLVLALSACKFGPEDVDSWKGTVKGPARLVALLNADKYSIELRTRAALNLVEMERTDVNGPQQLQAALQRLDEATRTQVVDGMVDGLIRQMKGEAQAQAPANGAPAAPTPAQIRAKDAAFELITSASPAARTKLVEGVVSWYVEDFAGRALSGNYSAEQVMRSLGASAANLLVTAMNARMPQVALIKIAELIGTTGDASAKRSGAERIVAIQREMESEPFSTWLKGQIRAQLASRLEQGQSVDESRVTAAAAINRENYIRDGAISAMKFLADQPTVANRLIEIASAPSSDVPGAARRKAALQALEGKATAAQLEPLLTIALDGNTPTDVRDYAFDRVGDIRSPAALPRLWPFVQNAGEQRLRWRVGEMVLSIGGQAAVGEFVTKLPSGDAKYAPEELVGYATRMAQMTPVPTDLVRPLLRSPQWHLRVLALRYFERKGTAADIPAMEALESDNTAVRGPDGSWQAGYTVGKVAESSIQGLRALLQQAGH